MIENIFEQGGWGMYPTLLLGTLTASIAFKYAARPDQPRSRALWPSATATLLSGLLGFLTGMIRTFQVAYHTPPDERFGITLSGLSESLWNVVLAFVLGVVVSVLLTVGELRRRPAGFA